MAYWWGGAGVYEYADTFYCCVWVGLCVCVLLRMCDMCPHTAVYEYADTFCILLCMSRRMCLGIDVYVWCVRILLCMSRRMCLGIHVYAWCVRILLCMSRLICLRNECCVRVFTSCSMCPHPAYIFGAAFISLSMNYIYPYTHALKAISGHIHVCP